MSDRDFFPHYPLYRGGAYGHEGDAAGSLAYALATFLPSTDEMPPKAAWSSTDARLFVYVDEFVGTFPFLTPNDAVDGSSLGILFRNLHAFTAALPFSEGERRWAFKSLDNREVPVAEDPSELWRQVETWTISAGSVQRLIGRELVRNWAAWRRSMEEFSDGAGLHEAIARARMIGKELLSGAEPL